MPDGKQCVEIMSDPSNCGAVENVCPGAELEVATCTGGVCGTLPPPSITGVSTFSTHFIYANDPYDPATGLLYTDEDFSTSPPESVLGSDNVTEYPVLSVAPEGLYLEPFLDPDLVTTPWSEGWGAQLIFPYTHAPNERIHLSEKKVILRGSNLRGDGPLFLSNPVGQVVPGEIDAIFQGDKIIVPWIGGATELQAFVELDSARGVAATPWPINWIDYPRFASIRAAGFDPASCENAAVCPPYVAYDTLISIEGSWFVGVESMRFCRPYGVNPPCEDVPPGDAQLGPEWYRVIDDKHMELMLSGSSGSVERGLTVLYYWTKMPEIYPGVRQIDVGTVLGESGGFSLAAVPPQTKAILGGNILGPTGYKNDPQYRAFYYYDLGSLDPTVGDRLVFQPNGFTVEDISWIFFVPDGRTVSCPATANNFSGSPPGSPVTVSFNVGPNRGSCRMEVHLLDGSGFYSPFTFYYSPPYVP
jgi:hypothetical protein